jgi:hypothetical protein
MSDRVTFRERRKRQPVAALRRDEVVVRVPGNTLNVVGVLRNRVDQLTCESHQGGQVSSSCRIRGSLLTRSDVVDVGRMIDTASEDVRAVGRECEVIDLLSRFRPEFTALVSFRTLTNEAGSPSPAHRLYAPTLLLILLVLHRISERASCFSRNPEENVAVYKWDRGTRVSVVVFVDVSKLSAPSPAEASISPRSGKQHNEVSSAPLATSEDERRTNRAKPDDVHNSSVLLQRREVLHCRSAVDGLDGWEL